jgi:hypothetical protein
LPAALNPVSGIKMIEIRDHQDQIILANSFGNGQPGGGNGQRVEKEARLVSTGVISNATGRARAKVEPEREELRVEGEDLISGASYEIVADGISLGAVVAQSGYFRVEFTSDGSSGQMLPAQLRPVTKIQQVEIRNSSGQAVLAGRFQAGGDDFGGGNDGPGDGGSSEVRREARLNPAGIDPNAEGEVKIQSSSSREELEIEAEDLNPNAQYTIVVDGFTLATVTTNGEGRFELNLSSQLGNLPVEVRPLTNIRRVDVLDTSGQVVLRGGPPV